MKNAFISFWAVLVLMVTVAAADSTDDTMLMFVGEEIEAVTAASRFPESPSQAPAVVDVITRKTIRQRGYRTLADLLSFEAGFYISRGARGSVPYYRGLRESLLFLYNGIPIPSGGSKSIYPIDMEMSLENVKQVEIIKGPGSVLWGADAFAGIVNIVPVTAADVSAGSASLTLGSDSTVDAHAAAGARTDEVEAVVTLRHATDKYHDDHYNTFSAGDNFAIETHPQTVDDSDFLEAMTDVRMYDWLTLFARHSDSSREYTVYEADNDIKWGGTKENPLSTAGLTASAAAGRSHFKFTSYFQSFSYKLTDIDTEFEEDLDQYYGELLWDYRLFRKGLLTTGAAYKENKVSGALVGGGFDPDDVWSPFPDFDQEIDQADYRTRVRSLFSQYRHQAGDLQLWAGFRLDKHSGYSGRTTWNIGASWIADPTLQVKAVVGTAYRAPYSQQVFEGIASHDDEIDTATLEVAWQPWDGVFFSISPYFSSVSGYVASDPDGGISDPISVDMYGVDLSAEYRFSNAVFFVNYSHTGNRGGNYQFRRAAEESSDGTVYKTWAEPFDTAPEKMLKLGALWRFNPDITFRADITYTDSVDYAYAEGDLTGEHDDYWLTRAGVTIRNLILEDSEMSLSVENLMDTNHTYSGFYGPVPGKGRAFLIQWRKFW